MGYSVSEWIKGQKFPRCELKFSKEEIYSLEALHGSWKESIREEKMEAVIRCLSQLLISNNFEESFSSVSKAFSVLMSVGDPSYGERRLIETMREKYLDLFKHYSTSNSNWREIVFGSDSFIELAVRLMIFDTYHRTGRAKEHPENIRINRKTIENIRAMVGRIYNFLKSKDNEICCGGEITSNTTKIVKGEWDFLTSYDIIDLKPSRRDSSSRKNWARIILYYLLAKEAEDYRFENIHNLILFNPRLNTLYIMRTSDIPKELIEHIKEKWGTVLTRMEQEEIRRINKIYRFN